MWTAAVFAERKLLAVKRLRRSFLLGKCSVCRTRQWNGQCFGSQGWLKCPGCCCGCTRYGCGTAWKTPQWRIFRMGVRGTLRRRGTPIVWKSSMHGNGIQRGACCWIYRTGFTAAFCLCRSIWGCVCIFFSDSRNDIASICQIDNSFFCFFVTIQSPQRNESDLCRM